MRERNAETLEDHARWALERGNTAESRIGLEAAQVKSRQRAAMGANNVDMSDGSAVDILTTTDYLAETDKRTARLNAAREAMGYRTQATNERMGAIMNRADAKGISTGAIAIGTLAGGAQRIASNWYSMKNAGALGRSPEASTNYAKYFGGGGVG